MKTSWNWLKIIISHNLVFFPKSNIKYRPDPKMKWYNSKTDSVHSDIDVIAINGKMKDSVFIVNYKAWQAGLNVDNFVNDTTDTFIDQVVTRINGKETPAVENTNLSRLVQLLIASGHEIVKNS